MLLLLSIFSIRGSSSVIRYGSQVVNWGGDDLVSFWSEINTPSGMM